MLGALPLHRGIGPTGAREATRSEKVHLLPLSRAHWDRDCPSNPGQSRSHTSATLCPCETSTSTCRSLATTSSGLCFFVPIASVLRRLRAILQGGPLRWGLTSRKIAGLLRAAGWLVNDKRVERLWRREGLKVPARQPRKGRLWDGDGSCVRLRPEHRNHVWSYDFVEARTHERVPFGGVTVYSMSKSALLSFTRGLARGLGPKGITVNLVSQDRPTPT